MAMSDGDRYDKGCRDTRAVLIPEINRLRNALSAKETEQICDTCLTEMPDHAPLKTGFSCPYCGYRHPPDGGCV